MYIVYIIMPGILVMKRFVFVVVVWWEGMIMILGYFANGKILVDDQKARFYMDLV